MPALVLIPVAVALVVIIAVLAVAAKRRGTAAPEQPSAPRPAQAGEAPDDAPAASPLDQAVPADTPPAGPPPADTPLAGAAIAESDGPAAEPGASPEPAAPQGVTTPEDPAQPEATTEPPAATQPEVTTQPEATTEPPAATQPEVTTQPEASTEPTATSEPESVPAIQPEVALSSIKPLPEAARLSFSFEWRDVQDRYAGDLPAAVAAARTLLTRVVEAGDYGSELTQEEERLAQAPAGSAEEARETMRAYRSVFDQLLRPGGKKKTPERVRPTTSGRAKVANTTATSRRAERESVPSDTE